MRDPLSEYTKAFARAKQILQRHRIDPRVKPSTSAVIARFGSYIIKAPDPRKFKRILQSQKRDSVIDFIVHEKEACALAAEVDQKRRQSRVFPTLLTRPQIIEALCSVGVAAVHAETLSEWVIGYDFFKGTPLGYYDEVSHKYVYNRHAIKRAGSSLVRLLHREYAAVLDLNRIGLFHNDLSPQNILFSHCSNNSFKLRIIDFGASYIDEKTSWNQPCIDFIDSWYARELGRPNFSLRDHSIRLRDVGISKDVFDWNNRQADVSEIIGY